MYPVPPPPGPQAVSGAPLSDHEIIHRMTLPDADPLRLRIRPFQIEQCKRLNGGGGGGAPCVSYGLTGKGYDVRLGYRFRLMRPYPFGAPVSPFADPDDVWEPVIERGPGAEVVLPPGGCALAETLEWVRVPEDCLVLVLCKSTWARCFLNLNTTPLEPGWQGTVTLELHNQSPRPLAVYAGHGVGQLVFFCGSAPDVPYNRRPSATYQDQSGPTPARLTAPDRPDGPG